MYRWFSLGLSITFLSFLDSTEKPTLSVEKEIKSGKKVTATCSVLHSCPSDPPHLTWSHQGKVSSQSSQQTKGQWKITSTLSFTPSRLDHKKILGCTVIFTGGKKLTAETTLSVTCKLHVPHSRTL